MRLQRLHMLPRTPRRKNKGQFPVVCYQSQKTPISEYDLDIGIRRGWIPLDAIVQFEPWTGQEFLPVCQIEALKGACQAPYALVIDHLRQEVLPWASGILFFIVLIAGVLQIRGWLGDDIILQAALGWSNTLVSGKWWTPWLSQLVHRDLFHLIGNVLILFYCAFRVERAFGFWSVWVSASLALLLGTLVLLLFGEALVVGSSIIVFGLWACQVAIGFRLAEILPRQLRGLYGWGNFLLFVPLLMINIMSKDVSNLAHVGGIIGGALVGFLYTSESMVIRKERRPWKAMVEVLSCHLAIGGLLWFGLRPSVASVPEVLLDRKEAGVIVTVPERMIIDNWRTMTVWKSFQTEEYFFYADSFWLSGIQEVSTEDIKEWWFDKLRTEIEEIELSVEPKEGWQDFFFQTKDKTIWERVHQEGKYLIRTGCTFQNDDQSRFQFCQYWLQKVQHQEPQELRQARERYERFSQTPNEAFSYASLLIEFGNIEKADEIYQSIAYRNDKFRWQSLYERVLLRLSYPNIFSWEDDRTWMDTLFAKIPISQQRLFEAAVRYANNQQQCKLVQRAWDRWSGLISVQDQSMYNLVKQCQE